MASRPYALVRRVDVHEFDGIRLIDDEPYVRLRDGTLVPMVRQEAGTGEPIDEWVRNMRGIIARYRREWERGDVDFFTDQEIGSA